MARAAAPRFSIGSLPVRIGGNPDGPSVVSVRARGCPFRRGARERLRASPQTAQHPNTTPGDAIDLSPAVADGRLATVENV